MIRFRSDSLHGPIVSIGPSQVSGLRGRRLTSRMEQARRPNSTASLPSSRAATGSSTRIASPLVNAAVGAVGFPARRSADAAGRPSAHGAQDTALKVGESGQGWLGAFGQLWLSPSYWGAPPVIMSACEGSPLHGARSFTSFRMTGEVWMRGGARMIGKLLARPSPAGL